MAAEEVKDDSPGSPSKKEAASSFIKKLLRDRLADAPSSVVLDLKRMSSYKRGIIAYHEQLLKPLRLGKTIEPGKKVDDQLPKFKEDEAEEWTYNKTKYVNRRYAPLSEGRWSSVGSTHDLRLVIAEDIVEILSFRLRICALHARSLSASEDDHDPKAKSIGVIRSDLLRIFQLLRSTVVDDQANPIRSALLLEAVFINVLRAIKTGRIDADSITLQSLREDVVGYRESLGKIAKELLEFLPQSGKEGTENVLMVMETGVPTVVELAYKNRNTNFLEDSLVETWVREMYAGELYSRLASGSLRPAARLPSDTSREALLFKREMENFFDPFAVPTFSPVIDIMERPLANFSTSIFESPEAASIPHESGYTWKQRIQAYVEDTSWYICEMNSPARYLKSPVARANLQLVTLIMHSAVHFGALLYNRNETSAWTV